MIDQNQKTKSIEVNSFQVSICKDAHLHPFQNTFEIQGINYKQQSLGQLFGVIQVYDYSENSEYIPNLITSVLKKEFFRNPKRGTEESFELALQRANLALSELAQHEIIQWIGKFSAAICAVCQDDLYFTQAGQGRIILVRGKKFNEISNVDNESAEHPMKTFSELSFGKIVEDDKIILATDKVFECFRQDELQRHAAVFGSDEFDNIFKSSLELEGTNVGAVVLNASKYSPVIKKVEKPIEEEENSCNFFGAESKGKETEKKETEEKVLVEKKTEEVLTKEKSDSETETKEEKPAPEVEENDKFAPFDKEPEIFIREEDSLTEEVAPKKNILKNISEKVSLIAWRKMPGKLLSGFKNFSGRFKRADKRALVDYQKTKESRAIKKFGPVCRGFFNQMKRGSVIGKEKTLAILNKLELNKSGIQKRYHFVRRKIREANLPEKSKRAISGLGVAAKKTAGFTKQQTAKIKEKIRQRKEEKKRTDFIDKI